jgi:hypothetical protein
MHKNLLQRVITRMKWRKYKSFEYQYSQLMIIQVKIYEK